MCAGSQSLPSMSVWENVLMGAFIAPTMADPKPDRTDAELFPIVAASPCSGGIAQAASRSRSSSHVRDARSGLDPARRAFDQARPEGAQVGLPSPPWGGWADGSSVEQNAQSDWPWHITPRFSPVASRDGPGAGLLNDPGGAALPGRRRRRDGRGGCQLTRGRIPDLDGEIAGRTAVTSAPRRAAVEPRIMSSTGRTRCWAWGCPPIILCSMAPASRPILYCWMRTVVRGIDAVHRGHVIMPGREISSGHLSLRRASAAWRRPPAGRFRRRPP